ncbi:hypothetical protein [Petropleomorpha daqingensis]|uniref:DUF2007 domain-containing protein n=1 Tax=Petropleomorpha daqingensis TaxID=2026353 RepID=A0A853CMP5_9ACTN|nr:hypothetical protein [Petropleomorpha daqingensis]NYJ08089.1 hypothetical protein [Petropleomorpha daqingensis]
MDVPRLTELLREAEEHHSRYEPAAPPHHWWDFYAAYVVARDRGRTADQADADAVRHVQGAGSPIPPPRPGQRDGGPPVLLAVVGSRAEADLMVGLLVSQGLKAAAVSDDAGGQEPRLQLQGGARVLVAAADEAAARRLLADTAVPTDG